MRRPPFLKRDPDIPRLALIGLAGGVAAGCLGFTIGSSRGLDDVVAHQAVTGLALVVLGGGVVVAAWRYASYHDPRVAILVTALVVGSVAGDWLAFRLLPGNTTDGYLRAWSRVSQPGIPEEVPQHATCVWDATRSRVLSVRTRVPSHAVASVGVPGLTSLDRYDLDFQANRTSVTVEVTAPNTNAPAYRYIGSGELALGDPSGRSGRIGTGNLSLEPVSTEAIDPELQTLIEAVLPPVTTRAVEWLCPAAP